MENKNNLEGVLEYYPVNVGYGTVKPLIRAGDILKVTLPDSQSLTCLFRVARWVETDSIDTTEVFPFKGQLVSLEDGSIITQSPSQSIKLSYCSLPTKKDFKAIETTSAHVVMSNYMEEGIGDLKWMAQLSKEGLLYVQNTDGKTFVRGGYRGRLDVLSTISISYAFEGSLPSLRIIESPNCYPVAVFRRAYNDEIAWLNRVYGE